MHQLPRPSPRTAAAANNPATNPERTNNSRDRMLPPTRTSSGDTMVHTERASHETPVESTSSTTEQSPEAVKLNQIISNFYTKAALIICSARANLPQAYSKSGEPRENRWFNIVYNETNALHEDLLTWKRLDYTIARPPPLTIEVYLDTTQLPQDQSLIVADDTGKRWDVADSLASYANVPSNPSRNGRHLSEVLLERWTVDLGDVSDYAMEDLRDPLPVLYKKAIVIFRSLSTIVNFLPAWKLHKKLSVKAWRLSGCQVKYRIQQQNHRPSSSRHDMLHAPLHPSQRDSVVGRQELPPVLCAAGSLSISVDYRLDCEFSTVDAEALLSSRFLGLDDTMPTIPAGRSLPSATSDRTRANSGGGGGGGGAMYGVQQMRPGAYGSLGTVHLADKRASPASALSARSTDPAKLEVSLSEAMRNADAMVRRPSIGLATNPPFKAGSLASSPRPLASPSTSVPRSETTPSNASLTAAAKRLSLNTLPQQHLRTPSEHAIASSGSSSPKPAPVHRYSSSFANRTKRYPTQGSKASESNLSADRASGSSKEKFGILNVHDSSGAGGTPGSSGSGRTDEDDIASFISQVESAKDLPSFHQQLRSPSLRDATVVNLAKYTSLRDPNGQLADEMSSSSLIQPSITPPSRRLSNVPGLSTSSSPSRALAHTPYVRSRLSTHSIMEVQEGSIERSGRGSAASAEGSADSPRMHQLPDNGEEDDDEEPFIFPLPQDSV